MSIPPDAVIEYILRTKGWNRDDYRIETRGLSADGKSEIVAIVHRDDERGLLPGAGKSVLLHLDRTSHQVLRELGTQ